VELLRQGIDLLPPAPANTTLAVVATNARLNKEEVNRLATVAHDGLARSIRPAHTRSDGDVIFAMATGQAACDLSGWRALEVLVCLSVERAVVKAIHAATGLGGIPSAREWTPGRPG
jgi:L-aminopeptidase/D-esterase-like protein